MSERLSGLQLSNCIVDAESLIRANEHAYVDPGVLQSARVQISMARELRERRAADLTDEERALLASVRAELVEMGMTAINHRQRIDPAFRFRSRDHEDEENAALTKRSLALLDKLLARKS